MYVCFVNVSGTFKKIELWLFFFFFINESYTTLFCRLGGVDNENTGEYCYDSSDLLSTMILDDSMKSKKILF